MTRVAIVLSLFCLCGMSGSGCSIRGEPRRFERLRWDAAEDVGDERGRVALSGGRRVLVLVEAGSALRIDAGERASAVRIEEAAALPARSQERPEEAAAFVSRPDVAFDAGGVALVHGPAGGRSVIALSATGTADVEVIVERLRRAPVEYRFEGEEERAKHAAAAAQAATALACAEARFHLAGELLEILLARARDPTLFWRERPLATEVEITRERPLELRASGPALLRIETRVPYADAWREPARRYALRVMRAHEDEPGAWRRAAFLPFATALDDLDGVATDARGRPVSRPRTAFALVPPGDHRVRIESAEPVLARVDWREKKVSVHDGLSAAEDAGAAIEEARAWARRAIFEGDRSPRPQFLLAACDALEGRAARAEEALARLAGPPTEGPLPPEPALALGTVLEGADDARALALYEEALAGAKRAPGTGDGLARRARLRKARLLEATGKAALAAAEYAALGMYADEGRALLALSGAERPDPAALAALDRALALDPGDEETRALRDTVRLHFHYFRGVAPVLRSDAFPEERFVPAEPPARAEAARDGARALLSAGEALALPPGEEVRVFCPRPTVAAVDIRGATGTALFEAAIAVDGEPAIAAAIATGRARLRLPLAEGEHALRLRVEGGPGAAAVRATACVLGEIAPADPLAPRLERVRFEPIGEGAPPLVYAPNEGTAPGFIQATVHLPEPATAGAAILFAVDGAPPRRVALEPRGPSAVYRFVLPVPGGEGRVEVAAEGIRAGGFALASLRRSREPAAPLPGGDAPAGGEATGPRREAGAAPESLDDAEAIARVERLSAQILAAGGGAASGEQAAAGEQAALFLARGRLLLGLDRPRLAAADFERTLAQGGPSRGIRAAALAGLAQALAAMGETTLALAAARDLVAAEPDDLGHRARHARVALAADEPLEAVETWREALRRHPGSREARLGLAEALARAGDDAGAARALDGVLAPVASGAREGPEAATVTALFEGATPGAAARALTLRALLAFRARRPEAALRALEQAIAILPVEEACRAREPEPGDDDEGQARAPLGPLARADLEALCDLARRLAPLAAAAADPAAPPRARAAALLAIARIDARWWLRAHMSGLAPVPEADLAAARRDRAVSRQTGRLSVLHDASGAGFLLRLEGPTLVRLEARADHGGTAPPATTIEVEPRSPRAPRATFDLDRDEPSPVLAYAARPGLLPGKRQLFDFAVPPGVHIVRVFAPAGAAHVRAFVLRPAFEDPLGGGMALEGPAAAGSAAAEALRVLERVEPGRLRLEARALLGVATPAERARLLAALAEDPLADPLDHATLLWAAGDPEQAAVVLERALAASPGEEAALFFVLLSPEAARGGGAARSAGLSPALAALATRGRLFPRVAAKLALAYISLGKRAREPAARWFTRALLLLRDLRTRYPEDAEVAALHEEALTRTTWSEVTGGAGTAGFERILVSAQLISQRAEVAHALVPEPRPGSAGALVASGREALFEVRLAAPADLLVEVRAEDLIAGAPGREPPPIALALALDGAPGPPLVARRGPFPGDEHVAPGWRACAVLPGLAAGLHRLEVALAEPGPARFAKVYLHASRPAAADAQPSARHLDRDWYPIVERPAIEYRVAAAGRPLRYRVRGPVLLRIDARAALGPEEGPRDVTVLLKATPPVPGARPFTFRAARAPGDAFRDRRDAVPSLEGRLRLPLPDDIDYEIEVEPAAPEGAAGPERLLVKTFARIDAPAPAPASPPAPAPAPLPVPAPLPELPARTAIPVPATSTAIPPAWPRDAFFGEEDGTLETFLCGAAFRRRKDAPEDRARQDVVELGVGYRRLLDLEGAHDLWLHPEVSVKLPDRGDPVARAQARALWRTPLGGIRWLNRIEGNLQPVEGESEGSLDLETRLDRLFPLPLLRGDLDFYLALGARAREQTLDRFPDGVARDEVYFDVFSPFYEDHDHWLYLRAALFFRPFLDLELFASGTLATNREWDPGEPDRASWRAGARGFEGPVAWQLAYEGLKRFVDDDRPRLSDEHFVAAALDAVIFTSGSTAVALDLEGRYYLDTGEAGIFAGVRFLFGRGRIFSDFEPGEVLFDEGRGYFYPEPEPGARP